MRYLFIILLLSSFELNASQKPLRFPDACVPGKQIVIAAVGDILLHHDLQLKASTSGFESLWQIAIPYLKAADVAYANLEGPVAAGINGTLHEVRDPLVWDYSVYTTYPLFNYHPSLPAALKHSGFGIVSNANNHALDRSYVGINKTIDALDQTGLLHVGSVKSDATIVPAKIIDVQGVRIAWIACTEHTNGNSDRFNQVLHCYRPTDRALIVSTIQQLKTNVDAIIVAPHWGDEYHPHENHEQMVFAHEVLDAGATAVIGAHPHVLEPVEKYTTKDGRSTLISYSLGNFVSHQPAIPTRSTVILLIGLTKTNSETIVNGVRYVPMYMENHSGPENLRLRMIANTPEDQIARHVIAEAIDEKRALYSLPIVTNPECAEKETITSSLLPGFWVPRL
jgi:hypothetical protein